MKRSYRQVERGETTKPAMRKNAGGGKRRRILFKNKEDAEEDRKQRTGVRIKRRGLN